MTKLKSYLLETSFALNTSVANHSGDLVAVIFGKIVGKLGFGFSFNITIYIVFAFAGLSAAAEASYGSNKGDSHEYFLHRIVLVLCVICLLFMVFGFSI